MVYRHAKFQYYRTSGSEKIFWPYMDIAAIWIICPTGQVVSEKDRFKNNGH